ncbi:phosphonate transport system substrate-binding protein [Eilatimonas milleporae]|uniref:Phosphonate transport system substrate-binding protein n=1 Tax=Eilatimonas milleporae TaxID=911205 RepID=A0A3M0CCM3_9PROT|nr:phosphonate transport system substrate-binding protein [Eilatimonas milleporae]
MKKIDKYFGRSGPWWRASCLIAGFVLLYHSAGVAAAEGERKDLTFGVVPQVSPARLAAAWVPFIQRLGAETGFVIRLRTAKTVAIFEERLGQGLYDIAYMNPYTFTVSNEHPGYRALARQKNKRIRGLIIVRHDSAFKTLDDLAGHTVAFSTGGAFAATLLNRAEFRRRGIDISAQFVGFQDSVYQLVAVGRLPAGGGVPRTFRAMPDEITDQLRILHETPDYTAHAIATHPRIGSDVRRALLQALLALDASVEGRQLLALNRFPGFEEAGDADWDDVRALNLDRILNQP